MVEIVCRELTVAWQPVGLSFSFERRQMQTQVARIISVTEKTLCLSFEIRMPHGSGLLNLAFPAVVANTILRRLTTDWSRRRRHAGETRARMERGGAAHPLWLLAATAHGAAGGERTRTCAAGRRAAAQSGRRHAFGVACWRAAALSLAQAMRHGAHRAARIERVRSPEASDEDLLRLLGRRWPRALFSQALAGEPELSESLPKPLGGRSFGLAATVDRRRRGPVRGVRRRLGSGDAAGRRGRGPEGGLGGVAARGGRRRGRRTAGGKTGKKCQVAKFEEIAGESQVSHAFQLRSGQRAWTILVRDEVREPAIEQTAHARSRIRGAGFAGSGRAECGPPDDPRSAPPPLSPGLELLLDVELEASLRFGSREMPLGEILDLGPGDVVELDRHVADPVDLIVGDKIVARGEVVLVNGNFGLRVTEVAAPRKRLESIRCLF